MKLTLWYDNQVRAMVVYNVKEFITNYGGGITLWTNDLDKFDYPKPLFFSVELDVK